MARLVVPSKDPSMKHPARQAEKLARAHVPGHRDRLNWHGQERRIKRSLSNLNQCTNNPDRQNTCHAIRF